MSSMIFLHNFMDLDDDEDDDGHANIFTLERQSEAAAHRVKFRPERIPSLRLPSTPSAAGRFDTRRFKLHTCDHKA